MARLFWRARLQRRRNRPHARRHLQLLLSPPQYLGISHAEAQDTESCRGGRRLVCRPRHDDCFLAQTGTIGVELAKLMLVALAAIYIGVGFLVAVYRLIDMME